jgi:predicted phosphodiesterase
MTGKRIAPMLALGLCSLALLWAGTHRAETKLNFAVIGDTGTGEEPQFRVAREMVKRRAQTPFDFVLMLGDNIYGGGKPQYFKPRFEEPYKELLGAGVKFYAALGNHDAPYAAEHVKYPHFNMGGRYYTFTKGDDLVQFFALDSNEMTPAQLAWLERELKDSKAKWKVAFLHHSIYSSARMHPPYATLRAQLEPLFVKHQVNIVFAGHSHAYERVRPQQGVQYITAGSGGKLMRGTLNRRSPLTVVGNDQIQIFLIVELESKTMMVNAISANGDLIDRFEFNRDAE